MSKVDEVTTILQGVFNVGGPKEEVEEVTQRSDRDDTGREDDSDGTEEEVQGTSETYSVKDLAKKLETTPAKLYESLSVPLSDGTTMTLSELKDLAVKGKTIDTHSERRDKDYNEIMIQRKEVSDVAQMLHSEGKLTEETINKLRERENNRITSEMEKLVRTLPDWENQSIRAKEIKQISQFTAQYGLSPLELDALVTDHRLMKLIRDVATKPMNKPTDIQPSGRSKPTQAKVDTTTKAGKLQAISALIN